MKRILGDIRFWIILFFLVRLIGITNPPLDAAHSWRQCFTAMVARNFLEVDANILYPRIDMAGAKEDIVASEFPVFNYLIFITAKLIGYDHWYGRLINLVISSFGIYFFYRLIKRHFEERVAFYATLCLLFSIWFSFSRKIMPDTFSVSLVIVGIYYASLFSDKGKWYHWLLFIVLVSLGGLSKVPAIVLSASVIPLIYMGSITENKKIGLLLGLVIIFLIIALWYAYWQPYLLETYGNRLYYAYPLWDGFQEILKGWSGALKKFYFEAFNSYIGFVALLGGLFFMFRYRNLALITIVALSSGLFLYFIIKAGSIFTYHNYYIIPFVPVMALLAGYGIASLPWKKARVLLMLIIALEGIMNQGNDFFVKEEERYKLKLEKLADKVSAKDDKIAVTGGLNPQQIYFTHRKGWIIRTEDINPRFLQDLKVDGCKYLFINSLEYDKDLNYKVVWREGYFVVYKL